VAHPSTTGLFSQLMKLLFLSLFLLVPLAEILLLIEIGKAVGILPTVALVLTTALIGVTLLRRQGLSVLAEAQAALDRGEMPVRSVADGACLLVAGAFLLTPGLITDSAGFLLLVPGFRRWLSATLMKRLLASGNLGVHTTGPFARPPGQHPASGDANPGQGRGNIIEAEYHEVSPDEPPPRDGPDSASSPWKRRK
jgi:UPF0716 protein FxsA